ncbi:MAG: choice-of-anchor D domain-containing protein, partial [Proteobacteria bacterium]|nr:choice-of-anchor D domain-containing protein [Pseudomonadota bacterium]
SWAPSELIGTSTTLLTLPSATDPDGDLIDACTVSNLTNVTITSPCNCSSGVCTIGVTTNGPGTSGSFSYYVSAGGLNSQPGTATLSFAPMPNLTFDPPARNYGSITVGETGGSFGFTITNSGTETARGCSAPTVSPSTQFQITSDSCGTADLAPGASCVVQVAPVPTSSGTQSATLYRGCSNIPYLSRTQSTTSNGLTVTAKTSAPVLTTYIDAPVDFGNVRVGSQSSTKEIILTNSGFGTLTGCSAPTLTNSSDYSIVSDTCGTSNLPKSASCVVTVAASPTTTGTLTSTLNRTCTQSTLTGVSLTSSGFSGSVSAVTLGDSQTCALISDGTIRCWGSNTYGQLGDGTTTQRLTPIAVSGISTATSVVMGTSHTCALLSDSTVKCWGRNDALQSGGTSTTTNSVTPTQIQRSAGTPLTGVSSIAAGANHTCAVLNSGTVFCWGQASVNGTASSSTYALQISNITDASTSAGAIAGGSGFACAVRTGGGVRCWGLNAIKQLGNNTTTTSTSAVDVLASLGVNLSGVSAVALGASTSCALTSGSVKCWGAGSSGQLGNGTTTSQNFPVSVSGISTASSIAGGAPAGNSFCAVLSGSSGIKCWGSNSYGIVGDGTSALRSTPVSVSGISNGVQIALGISHACVLSSNTQASVQCWGNASSGQTGDGLPNVLSPKAGTILSSVLPVSQVMAGGSSACALTQSGSAQCWGRSTSPTPYLGNGGSSSSFQSPVTVTLGTGLTATAIAPGVTHSCVLLSNSTIKCWGVGSSGQIGNGATSAQATPQTVSNITTAIQVGSGNLFSCALLSNKTVWCWGANNLGQLGNAPGEWGTGTDSAVPVQVSGITDATQISVGYDHACALLTNQTVKCWGDNTYGQYGNGATTAGGVAGNIPNQAAFTKVIMISTGYRFTCALLNDNTVQCAGYGGQGTLGNGGTSSSYADPVTVQALEDGTSALTRITSIVSNYSSTCGIRKSNGGNQLVCWGRNDIGNNGLGNLNTTSYRRAVEIPGMLGISSVTASVADKSICAIDSSGTPLCFGNNDVNQTGVHQMGVQNTYGL